MSHDDRKPLIWVGSSKKDLLDFPGAVQHEAGYALYVAQCGDKHRSAVPMAGFGGTKVIEIALDNDGNTYRAVYAAQFDDAIYVLHTFQKKSRKGKATPRSDLAMIKRRFKEAKEIHDERQAQERSKTDHGKAKRKREEA